MLILVNTAYLVIKLAPLVPPRPSSPNFDLRSELENSEFNFPSSSKIEVLFHSIFPYNGLSQPTQI